MFASQCVIIPNTNLVCYCYYNHDLIENYDVLTCCYSVHNRSGLDNINTLTLIQIELSSSAFP